HDTTDCILPIAQRTPAPTRLLLHTPPPPPWPTLFPYTTLFRSPGKCASNAAPIPIQSPTHRQSTASSSGSWAAIRETRLPQSGPDRKSTRLNSSHLGTSYAVFCLKKKNRTVRSRDLSEVAD